MLHIIGSTSVKEGQKRLLERYIQGSLNSRTYFIVPEQATLITDMWLMEELKEEALMDVRAVSFERLTREVLSVTAGRRRPFIDAVGKSMVLRTVFEDYKDEFQVFREGAHNQDFLSHALRLLTELKRSGISYQQLEEVAASSDSEILRRKLREIALMQRRMKEILEGNYSDNEDRMLLLCEEIKNAQHLKGVDIYLTFFNGFTGLEYEVIGALLENGNEVQISLPLGEERRGYVSDNVFSATEETLAKLRKLAEKRGIKVEFEYCKAQEGNKELAFFGKELFSFSKVLYQDEPESIELRDHQSTEEEVHAVARKIKELVMYRGARYRNIGLCVTDSNEYVKRIRRVFSMYDIPVFIDEKRELFANPMIASIKHLIECMAFHMDYAGLFTFLKLGFANLERREIEVLENYSISHKIRGTMYFEQKYFERGIMEEEERQELLGIQKKLTLFLSDFYKQTRKKKTVSEFVRILIDFLLENHFPRKLEIYIEELEEEGLLDFANENRQVWDVFIDIVNQLVELVGNRRVDIEEFGEILMSGMEGHEIGIIPPAQDQIMVATLDRSRNKTDDYLFVLGLCEGYFPKQHAEVSLFTREERSELEKSKVELPSVPEKVRAEERLSFYLNTTTVSKKLFLSYALSDHTGKPLRPSYYVTRLREMMIALSAVEKKSSPVEAVYGRRPLLHLLARNLREVIERGCEEELFWREAVRLLSKRRDEELERLMKALQKTKEARYIQSRHIGRMYGDRVNFSTSRLEQFSSCPYKHFVRYALSPKERTSYNMEATDIGILLHESIDEFTARLKRDPSFSEEKCREEMDAIFEEKAKQRLEVSFENTPRNRYMLEKLKKTACEVGGRIFRQMKKGEFRIWGQEVDFGYKQELPAVTLLEDRAYLRGRIDRIDVMSRESQTYIKIIDYKTSRKSFDLSDAWNGLDIQLIVYLFASLYSRAFGEDKVLPAGVFYFPAIDPLVKAEDEEELEKARNSKTLMKGIALKDEAVLHAIDKTIDEYSSVFYGTGRKKYDEKENLLSEEEFDRLIERVLELAKQIAQEILSGRIEVSPVYRGQEDTACTYCNYKSICRFDERVEDEKYRPIRTQSDEEIKVLLNSRKEAEGHE